MGSFATGRTIALGAFGTGTMGRPVTVRPLRTIPIITLGTIIEIPFGTRATGRTFALRTGRLAAEIAFRAVTKVLLGAFGETAACRLVAKAALGPILKVTVCSRTACGPVTKVAFGAVRKASARRLVAITAGWPVAKGLAALGAIGPLGAASGFAEAAGGLFITIPTRAAVTLGLEGLRGATIILEMDATRPHWATFIAIPDAVPTHSGTWT